jgi:hypothetical protein
LESAHDQFAWEKNVRQVCATQLHDLVELVRGELSKLARRTLTAPRRFVKGWGSHKIKGDFIGDFHGIDWDLI